MSLQFILHISTQRLKIKGSPFMQSGGLMGGRGNNIMQGREEEYKDRNNFSAWDGNPRVRHLKGGADVLMTIERKWTEGENTDRYTEWV